MNGRLYITAHAFANELKRLNMFATDYFGSSFVLSGTGIKRYKYIVSFDENGRNPEFGDLCDAVVLSEMRQFPGSVCHFVSDEVPRYAAHLTRAHIARLQILLESS